MSKNVWWWVAAAAGLFLPVLIYPAFAMELICFALFAVAFNLLLGYGGLLSFGHAAFFGCGAYVGGYFMRDLGWPPELAVLAAGLGAAVLGLAFGKIAIRRQGIYFAMITMALAQVFFFIILKSPFSGGEDGLQGIPQGKLLGLFDLQKEITILGSHVPLALYLFVYGIFLLCFALVARVIHSPFGQVIEAIRENESRALSLGYRIESYKLVLFAISAGMSGVAGCLKALVTQLASLSDVSWQTSGEVILMTLLGGMGTQAGPLVGAGLVRWLHNTLAGIGMNSASLPGIIKVLTSVNVVIGIIFVLSVMLFRRGIVGEIKALLDKYSRSARG